MFYKCPECSKIVESYVEKCPDCGYKISLSDSVSDAGLKNIENVEETEGKLELYKKRVRNGYAFFALSFIVFFLIGIVIPIKFDIPFKIFELIYGISYIVICLFVCIKCRFFCCPYCDIAVRPGGMHRRIGYEAIHALYCPHCGKRIRVYED